MGAGIEVTNKVRPQVEQYIRDTYKGVDRISVMDVDCGMVMSTNFAGIVTFEDGTRKGFDYRINYDGTFESMPSKKKGHIDLWDTKTYEVMPVG